MAVLVQEGRSVFPDARFEAVLECLAGGHRLVPVVSRDDSRQVVGVITVADLSQAIAAEAT